jgi:glycosyltransferase involved in cell wall biosynthesis
VIETGRAADVDRSVAVVMRTRDRPLFLRRALESVLAQTFGDFELIVVNDGGDRQAVEPVVQALGLDERVRVLHIAESTGMGAASNRAIHDSRSTYVAIHDDDDTWDPSFLERTTRRLEETNQMGVIATTDKIVERVDGEEFTRLEQTRLHSELQFVNLYRMCLDNYATPISFIYRRSAYETVGDYDEALESAGDWEFALRFLTRFDIEFLRTPEALAFYHHRPRADGIELNAVYTDSHRYFENQVANALLRRDILSGKPGLGMIVNSLKYERDRDESILRHLQQASSVQVDYLADCTRKVDERLMELQHAVTPGQRLRADLAFLRSLPGKIIGRPGHRAPA